jgi:hypothetical protein
MTTTKKPLSLRLDPKNVSRFLERDRETGEPARDPMLDGMISSLAAAQDAASAMRNLHGAIMDDNSMTRAARGGARGVGFRFPASLARNSK